MYATVLGSYFAGTPLIVHFLTGSCVSDGIGAGWVAKKLMEWTMNWLRKLIICLLAIASGVGTAVAAEYQGYVSSIMASGGKIFVVLNNGSGSSICTATARFYLDPGDDYDRAMLALALSAKAQGSLVYAAGSDTCVSGWPYYDSQQLTAINVM